MNPRTMSEYSRILPYSQYIDHLDLTNALHSDISFFLIWFFGNLSFLVPALIYIHMLDPQSVLHSLLFTLSIIFTNSKRHWIIQ
jgi:hypothetical protein